MVNKFPGFLLHIAVIAALIISGCENNPGDAGLNFISPNDTIGVKYLDSQADSMDINSSTFKNPINSFGSFTALIGKYQSYDSKTLMKFNLIDFANLDSAVVQSAKLFLKGNGYNFRDQNGITAFDAFKLTRSVDLRTVTTDSLTAGTIGNVSVGNYSGNVNDSQFISFSVDNQTVKDWFEYAADTAYPVKNHGIALVPSSSSTSIKGFHSYFVSASGNRPYMDVIYSKNGVTDTVRLDFLDMVSLTDAPVSVVQPGRFVSQSGISFRGKLTFDLSKLPPNVTINNANLTFVLDKPGSYIDSNSSKALDIGVINDTSNNGDTLFTEAFLRDSVTYSVNLNQTFQRWNFSEIQNFGITIRPFSDLQNIDFFSFYSPDSEDPALRPRLRIYYTPRN